MLINSETKKNLQNLKEILGKGYVKKSFYIFVLMVFGMLFEILFLNNLVILLNLFTSTNKESSIVLDYIGKYYANYSLELKVLGIFILSFFLKTSTNILVSWAQTSFMYNSQAFISKNYYQNYLSLPLIYFQRTNTAEIIRKLTREIENLKIFIFALLTLSLEILVLLGITIYLLNYNFFVSLVSILSFLSFAYILNIINRKRFINYGNERMIYETKRIKSIIEGLSSVREIKIRSKEKNVIENFYSQILKLASIGIKSTMIMNVTRPIFEIFLLTIICTFLIVILLQGSLSLDIVPILGLYLAASYRLVPSIAKIVHSFQNLQLYSPSVNNLYRDKKIFDSNLVSKKDNKKFEFENFIEFKDVNFTYGDEKLDNKIIKNLNFKIKKNCILGIEGKSGSGKSTLIDLLIGLYKTNSGEISVDGKNIQKNPQGWQQLIGCVPQEVFIIDDTLRKNIAFGMESSEIDDDKVYKSIKFAFLDEYLNTLDQGLDTIIGEKGSKISGGQRQRIGIARAVYNNPEILIFDESTNALDPYTEKKILDEINLLKGKKTIILVSHKKNNLKNCDEILSLDN